MKLAGCDLFPYLFIFHERVSFKPHPKAHQRRQVTSLITCISSAFKAEKVMNIIKKKKQSLSGYCPLNTLRQAHIRKKRLKDLTQQTVK